MSRHERRHQLVAQLLRAHRRAVAVARLQQQREHVISAVAVATALIDQLIDQLVGLCPRALKAPEPPAAREQGLRGRQQRHRAVAEREHLRQQLAERVQLCAALQAEHGAQDDLQCEAPELRLQRHRLIQGPGRNLALGQLGHQARQALHLLAVERRQQQLALLEMRALVEQDDRVGTDHWFQDVRALAGVQDVGGSLEEGLDLVGIGQQHERRLAHEADREASAVARPATLQEGGRPAPPADRLQHGRHPRARRQRILHGSSSHS